MDFQEIRRKAKERAARAVAAAAPTPVVGPGGEPAVPPPRPGPPEAPRAPGKLIEDEGSAGAGEGPAEGEADRASGLDGGPTEGHGAVRKTPRRPAPGSPEALRLEAELAGRLASLSPAADARFVTWRPDGGPLPAMDAIAPAEGELLEPRRETSGPPAPLDALEDFFYSPDESAGAFGALVAPAGAVASPAVPLDEYLLFRLAGEEFGVEIGRVLEVMRTPPVTEVPRAPPDVLGIISVRGEVITVVDPRARFGLASSAGGPARRVVVVDDGEGACGLLVDQVAGVVRLPRGALEPCPDAIAAGAGEVFLGIGRVQQRLFTVLDARALLGPLRRATEAHPT